MITTNKKHDEQAHPQTQLLADHRKNEVGVGIRKVEHFLPAVSETEAFHSAAPPRDQGLHLLQTGVVLKAFRIHERGKPAHSFRHVGGDEKNSAQAA